MAHRHTVDAADHLSDASTLLTTPGMVVPANVMVRPLIRIQLPIMNTFMEEAHKKREETMEK